MSNATPRSDYEKFRDEQLKDPLVRAAYEDARARNSLVDRLVRRRHFLRLTQREVAREMGVGQPTISGFETEDSDPRLSTLLRYARAVHATLDRKSVV